MFLREFLIRKGIIYDTRFWVYKCRFFLNVKSLPRPGETVLCPSYTFYPGGKGANQAVAAARLGAEVMFAGSVGKDPYGGQVLKSLRMWA